MKQISIQCWMFLNKAIWIKSKEYQLGYLLRFVNNLKVNDRKVLSHYLLPDEFKKADNILIMANQVSFSILHHCENFYSVKHFEIFTDVNGFIRC